MSLENKEEHIKFSGQQKENALPEQIFNPDAEIANFRSKPSFDDQRLDTYAKAVHRLIESHPSPQAAQRTLKAHLEIMKTLGNAREVLDAIANTRAEEARIQEGQSTFTEDIVALNTIIQAEKQRLKKEEEEKEKLRAKLGISKGNADVKKSAREPWKEIPVEQLPPQSEPFLKRIFGRFFKR